MRCDILLLITELHHLYYDKAMDRNHKSPYTLLKSPQRQLCHKCRHSTSNYKLDKEKEKKITMLWVKLYKSVYGMTITPAFV